MFTDPPPQLRLVSEIDSVRITLSGVAPPLAESGSTGVGIATALLLAGGAMMDAIWLAVAVLIVGAFVLTWSSSSTAQTEVEITPTHVRWNNVELPLAELTEIELVTERGGPALQLQHRQRVHLLHAQNEPEHHVRWVAEQLLLARDRCLDRGTMKDVPRSIQALRE